MRVSYLHYRIEHDQFLDGTNFFSCVDEMLQDLATTAAKAKVSRPRIGFPDSGMLVSYVVNSAGDYVSGDV